MRRLHQTAAMTLVELMVVIVTIGIVAALIVPSLQSARQAARRMQCMNNIRQISLAVAGYETMHKEYPASIEFSGVNFRSPETSPADGPNWLIRILPHLEEQSVYDSFDLDKSISAAANRTGRGALIAGFFCPDDVGNATFFSRRGEGDNWARGNYAANASHWHFPYGTIGPNDLSMWKKDWVRGMMGANTNLRSKDIVDGLSKTILVTELKIGLVSVDRRGTWAMGAPGASSIWAHASDDSNGPNSCGRNGDNIWGAKDIVAVVSAERLNQECMSVPVAWDRSTQAAPRSRHPGGVNVGFGDGSVKFITNNIQTRTGGWNLMPQFFGTWERLTGSADGQSVADETY